MPVLQNTINVKTETGELIELSVQSSDTIEQVKAKIQDKKGIQPGNQIIMFNSKELKDDRTLADYNIQIGSTIDLLVKNKYEMLEGMNSEINIDTDKNLTFKSNGDFDLFTDLKIDDVLVANNNYIAESGSTIVTLNNQYLKTLSVGAHKIEMIYSNGQKVATNFNVIQNASEVKPVKDVTPKTGNFEGIKTAATALITSLIGIKILTKKHEN